MTVPKAMDKSIGKIRKLIAPIILILFIVLFLLACKSGLLNYQRISREVSSFLALLFTWLPFSVAEIVMYLLPFLIVGILSLCVFLIIKKRKKILKIFILKTLTTAIIIVITFYLIWGLNYSLDNEIISGYDYREYTQEELLYCCDFIFQRANELSDNESRGLNTKENKAQILANVSTTVTEALREKTILPKFGVSKAKPFRLSFIWKAIGIEGLYFPFTGESNVLLDNSPHVIPYAAAHEISHRLGVAREDEANFAAFLLLQNGNEIEQYSAYSQAWIYVGNRLAATDLPAYRKYTESMTDNLRADMEFQRERAFAIQDSVIADISTSINDTYLKVQGQSDGVKSYSKAAAYLVDWVLKNYPPDGGEPLTGR